MIHPLTSQDYLDSLSRFPRYLAHAWHDLGDGRGFFGDSSHGENGIRAMGSAVFVAALLAAESAVPERDELLAKARAGLAYLTRGHVTGDLSCGDGQRWGGVWQSAWWTTRMAQGAKLIWPELSAEERDAVQRVVVFEADLLLPRIVASGLAEDTKAEENAWETEILATALALCPEHPHSLLWREKLCEFAYNTFSVAADRHDARIRDGKPINDWVYTVNLYSDFTLENHGAYHFCYVASPLHSLAWASHALLEAGLPVPEALSHHVADVWRQVKSTFLRDRFAYVGGQDWARYTYGAYFIVPALVWMRLIFADADTRAIEQARFACLREEQAANPDGSFFGSRFTAPRYHGQWAKYETDCYANLGLAYRLHRLIETGKVSEYPALEASPLVFPSYEQGRLVSPECGVAYVRTPELFASFSWKTLTEPYPLALFMPVAREELLEWQPDNLLGRVVLWREQPSAVWIRRMRVEGAGFRVAGTVIYRGAAGQILYTQELLFAVDPVVGTAEVRSRFVASERLRVRRLEGLRLAIANDRWNGCRLDYLTATGKLRADFDPEARPLWMTKRNLPTRILAKLLRETLNDGPRHRLEGRWVNVDGALGIIALGEQPPPFELYRPKGRNLPDGSLHFDLLFCPLERRGRVFQAGEEMLNSHFLLVAGDADKTRAIATAQSS